MCVDFSFDEDGQIQATLCDDCVCHLDFPTNERNEVNLTPHFFYRLLRVFVVAFVGVFITFAAGIAAAPDLTTAKSLAYAAVSASLAAGAHAVLQAFTTGQAPFPGAGVLPPPN